LPYPRAVSSARNEPTRTQEVPRQPDSADQLRYVMAAEFEAVRVMSLEEYKVFREVEGEATGLRRGYRVFSQTSLGEVIRSKDRLAHSAINSKRVDVLVISANGLPLLAVEYQGGAHYQGDAAARDAVKKEALRRAGVGYVEVHPADGPEDIRRKVREVLAPAASTLVAQPAQISSIKPVT
jgi:Protein of unknown function (DUF2726)